MIGTVEQETKTQEIERAANEIRRAYATYHTQYGQGEGMVYMSTVEIHNRCDLTTAQIAAGVLHLLKTDRNFLAIPESNQKVLTQEQRNMALWVCNQWEHYISWD